MTPLIARKSTLTLPYLILPLLTLFYDTYDMVLEGNHKRFPPTHVESTSSPNPMVGNIFIVQTLIYLT